MNYFYSLTATIALSTPGSYYAMETNMPRAKTTLITALSTTKPQSVICLQGDTVAVLGKEDCSIYDMNTTKKITSIQTYPNETEFQYIAVDHKKEILAFYRKNLLELYDLKSHTKIWSKIQQQNLWQGAPVLTPLKNMLFIGNIIDGIDAYHYKKDSSEKYNPFNRMNNIPYATQLACHPTKSEMIFLADTRVRMPILQFDTEPLIKELISLGCGEAGDTILGAIYSPDGSVIAINNQIRGCSLYNPTAETNSFINEGEQIAAMIFHPTTCIVATLPQTGTCISYWNTQTSKLIALIPLAETYFYSVYPLVPACEPISFSEDGTKIIIALELKDKCLIMDVPNEVLEQSAWDKK